MLTMIVVLASLGQCSGGSCALPSAGYGFAPQFAAPQFQYAPVAPATPPQLWRAVDSEGSAFTHADPSYLQGWIAQRNAAIKTAKPPEPKAPPPAATLCPCARGECPCLAKAAKAAVMPPQDAPAIVALGPPPPEPR